MKPSRAILVVAVLALSSPAAGLPAVSPFPPPTSKDRILILSPHEDDETLGTGGLIQQAVEAGAAVRIVYLTYGDHNELAFRLYRKRLGLTPSLHEQMGELRRTESLEAMSYLGVPGKEMVFLGYPDGGMLEIWKKNWGRMPPFKSRATRATTVPYADAFSYRRRHKGEEGVKDLERQLLEFQPTRIFVTQPVDGHPDHRAYYLFLQVALRNVAGRLPPTEVFTYPIHIGTWPSPRGSRPDEPIAFPKPLADAETPWWSLELTPEQARRKAVAIRVYKTQTVDSLSWMEGFARKNELFNSVPEIPLRMEEWSSLQGVVAGSETEAYERESPESHLAGVEYRNAGPGLQIRIKLRRPLEQELGVSLYAFGYRRRQPFGTMPKLRINGRREHLRVWDRGFAMLKSGIQVETDPKEVLVTIPWLLLGEPDTVFVQVQGQVSRLSVSQTSWRILRRE